MVEEVTAQTNEKESRQVKRSPAIPVAIKDLNADLRRVRITGTVVNKNPELYSFTLDDGEATVLVMINDIERFESIKEGQFVQVLGLVWGEDQEIEIRADVVHDFSKIDRKLYKQVFEDV